MDKGSGHSKQRLTQNNKQGDFDGKISFGGGTTAPGEKCPLISIIIPVYNVAPYIREAVESAVNQTYKNLEIILIDDESTDGSGQICDEYVSRNHRITVIHQKHHSCMGSFGNVCGRECPGLF